MKPYSEEVIIEIAQLEEKYDIELVSVEHVREWVDRCERLTVQRDALLMALHQILEEARQPYKPGALQVPIIISIARAAIT